MKLDQIVRLLEADVLTEQKWEDVEITTACAADLMSDVLAFTKAGAILITGLINPQCVRTAEMVEIHAICFVRGKTPPVETLRLAEEAGIPLIRARFSSYVVSGMLFMSGLLGCDGSI